MQPNRFLGKIKQQLNEIECSQVITALRQDSLIWNSLQDEMFSNQAAETIGAQAPGWNPARLAWVALGQPFTFDVLLESPMQPLTSDLRQKAAAAFEIIYTGHEAPGDLAKIGLAALALRERRRMKGTWNGISSELLSGGANLLVWKTTLACLYSLIPDATEMLQALLPKNVDHEKDAAQREVILHSLLCNPAELEDQCQVLTRLLTRVSPGELTPWLDDLYAAGRGSLAQRLAQSLAFTSGAKALPSTTMPEEKLAVDPLLSALPLLHIEECLNAASINGYAKSNDESFHLLSLAWEDTRRLQAQVAARLARAAHSAGDSVTALQAWEQAVSLAPESITARTGLATALADAGKPQEALASLPQDNSQPAVKMAAAYLAMKTGDHFTARTYALEAAHDINKGNKTQLKSPRAGEKGIETSQMIGWVLTLIGLELPEPAIELLSALIENRPADIDLLDLLAQAHAKNGNLEAARSVAETALAIAPTRKSLCRQYASILESANDWQSAFAERSRISEGVEPDTDDLLSLARCAIEVGQPDLTVNLCQSLLSQGLEDHRTYTLIGTARMSQGCTQEAIEHFTQATLVCPESPEAWLALSNAYSTAGDEEKSHETLRSAVLAADPSAEIFMAMAQASLNDGSPSEALPHLRRAAALRPNDAHIQFRLGDTLYRLGHLQEANQVLEPARTCWPEHSGISLAFAHTLLAKGEREKAVPALLACLPCAEQRNEAALVLGRALVELIENYDEDIQAEISLPSLTGEALSPASEALDELLQAHPGQVEAQVISGLLHLALGHHGTAHEMFSELAETAASLPAIWHWRARFGHGCSALAVNEVETALAALQEAAAMQPDNARVQRKLAEAFFAADLQKDGLRVSKIALRTAPQELSNLAWYARLMLKLGFLGEAAETLEHAAQVAPNRSDVLLWLGQVQLQNGDITGVSHSLSRLPLLSSASAEQLQLGSDLLIKSGDLPGAIVCLDAALKKNETPSISILSTLIELHQQAGNTNEALEALQQAREIDPHNLQLALIQSDLLIEMKRNLAALDVLRAAIEHISPAREAGAAVDPSIATALRVKAASLHRANGDLSSALNLAETALSETPDFIQATTMVASLAFAMMDDARLDALIAGLSPALHISISSEDDYARNELVELLCTCAERLLEKDLLHKDIAGEVHKYLDEAAHLAPTHARTLANQSRLLAKTGEVLASAVLYDQSRQANGGDTTLLIALGEAGLALERWSESLAYFQQAAEKASQEPRPWFHLARAIALQAEVQRTCDALEITVHAPGEIALTDESYRQFEHAVVCAERLTGSPEVCRWRARGQAAFHPDAQTARELAQHLADATDMAAYVALMNATRSLQDISRASQAYPSSPEVMFQLALALHETEPETSHAIANMLVDREPQNPRNHVLLSKVIQFDQDAALQALETALMAWPDEPLWQKRAAEMCEQAGDITGANDHWQQVSELRPDDPLVALSYGNAAFKQGNLGQAILILDKSVSLDEDNINAWLALALAQQQAGSLKPALAAVERAVAIDRQNLDALALYGEIALGLDEPDLAAQRAQEMLAISPNNPQGELLYIRSQAASGNHAEALAAIEHALSDAADPFHLLYERACLKQQLNGAASGLPYWLELSQAYPDRPEVLAPLAAAQAEVGQSAAAEKTAQASLTLDPGQPALHLLLGRVQRVKGQLDQAIHHLSEAVRQSPALVEPYLELGRAYQDRRDYVQALKVFRQATHIAPEDSRPFYQAGLVMRENKDFVGAESMLRRAAKLAPDDPNIRRHLGAIIALNLVHHPEESSFLP